MNGLDWVTVKALLRQKEIVTTMRYWDVWYKRKAVEGLPKVGVPIPKKMAKNEHDINTELGSAKMAGS